MPIKNIIAGLFSKSDKSIIEQLTDTVDEFVTTKEEKEQLKANLVGIMQDHEGKLQAELTNRLKLDMASDSWLSKNIRPMSLIFTTVLTLMLALADGNIGEFSVKESYIKLMESLLMIQYMFYFGSRGFEKIFTSVRKEK